MTTLVNHQRKSKSGKSKKATQLAKEIDEATERLVVVGESISNDFPEIKEPMLEACKEARSAGMRFYCCVIHVVLYKNHTSLG